MIHPPETTGPHHITFDHGVTAYWEYGDRDGYPVVAVHGFRGDHHGLEGIAQAMVGCRVIVPDLPGFGCSQRLHDPHTLKALAEWLETFLVAVLDEPFGLLGHSFGSLVVAQAIAGGVAPERLTLINPITIPALAGPQRFMSKVAELYYLAGAKLPEPIAGRLLAHPGIVRVMSETMVKTRELSLRRWIHVQHDTYFSTYTDRQSLLDSFRASISHTVKDYADSFRMPVQIIAGEEDNLTPLVEQVRFANELPAADFMVVRGSGHLVHYEAVRETADRVSGFMVGEVS